MRVVRPEAIMIKNMSMQNQKHVRAKNHAKIRTSKNKNKIDDGGGALESRPSMAGGAISGSGVPLV